MAGQKVHTYMPTLSTSGSAAGAAMPAAEWQKTVWSVLCAPGENPPRGPGGAG